MKILCIDNYNRKQVSDVVICENVNEYWGDRIVDLLRDDPQRVDTNWFKLVPNSYKPYKYNPNGG